MTIYRSLFILILATSGCGVSTGRGNTRDGGNKGDPDLKPPCSGLSCHQVDCGELASTSITGTVYAPNGTLPIFNAIVYIPNGDNTPFTEGVTCDRCDGNVSGSPIVQTLTGPDGKFQLDNVPAGADIPLVIQIGKWRRRVTISDVPACELSVVDKTLTRLPKNKQEGDIPKMAIATGSADPFECLLLKIGIDENEIKEPGNNTRVEFFQAAGYPGTVISTSTPVADDVSNGMYSNMTTLLGYDIVMLPCEGSEFDHTSGGNYAKNIVDYLDAGGRVFATHYSYAWLTYNGSPYNKVSQPLTNGLWNVDQSDYPFGGSVNAKLVTNFPKGMAFAKWLGYAGATSAPNTLDINEIRHDIDNVNPMYAQPWARIGSPPFTANPGIAHLTFNTPIDAPADDAGNPAYCGRVVYSDFHVAASAANSFLDFPMACIKGALTDQEKALAFMLFDLSSCVQSDQIPIM